MQKFSVVVKIRGCLHTFHFIDDDIEMTDDELNEFGDSRDYGFCHGGCSHTGDLSRTELRRRCRDLALDLSSSALSGPFSKELDMKHCSARTRSRIAAYEKSAKAHFSIAARGRELSKIEEHAMLRWEEERMRILQNLESQDVNIKQLLLTAVIQHYYGLF
jgi:hypothetical protein